METLLTPSSPCLHYDVVLEWIALLLDVHFTQLVLEPEARQLLTSLQSQVSKQVGTHPAQAGLLMRDPPPFVHLKPISINTSVGSAQCAIIYLL